jgi:hypothetical protein
MFCLACGEAEKPKQALEVRQKFVCFADANDKANYLMLNHSFQAA